jgi:hypothetical protein
MPAGREVVIAEDRKLLAEKMRGGGSCECAGNNIKIPGAYPQLEQNMAESP